jgi:hypothetical protein
VTIDFTRYKDWLSRHPDHRPPDVLPDEFKTPGTGAGLGASSAGRKASGQIINEKENRSPLFNAGNHSSSEVAELTLKMRDLGSMQSSPTPESTPAWQASAPKAPLYVDRKAIPQGDGAGSVDSGDEPAYPIGFAQMLEMLQKGIPIPGIRQIPDTVIRDPVSLLSSYLVQLCVF